MECAQYSPRWSYLRGSTPATTAPPPPPTGAFTGHSVANGCNPARSWTGLRPARFGAILARMEIIEWWPKLDPDAQTWLIAHNGLALSPEVLDKIVPSEGPRSGTLNPELTAPSSRTN